MSRIIYCFFCILFFTNCEHVASYTEGVSQDITFVEFTSLDEKIHNSLQIPSRITFSIKESSEWIAFWESYSQVFDGKGNKIPAPEIDFDDFMITGLTWGKTDGCDNLSESIHSMFILHDTLFVDVGPIKEKEPCLAQIFPIHLVQIETNNFPIEFILDMTWF